MLAPLGVGLGLGTLSVRNNQVVNGVRAENLPFFLGMAIRVEERYKSIRAPHKIKGAVSGCVRECAEAQNKDFGLIATERVCGLVVCVMS